MGLSQNMVDALRPDGKDRFVWDDTLSGFGVRIKPSGAKSYVLQYRAHGRAQRISLGKCGQLSVKEARKRALEATAAIARGEDPAGERRAVREALTVADLCDYFKGPYAQSKGLSQRYLTDSAGIIARHILPRWGRWKAFEVTSEDVVRLKLELNDRPIQCNRVLALVSRLMTLAIRLKARRDNPAAGIEKNREHHRERYLNPEEMKRLFEVVSASADKVQAAAIKLLVLTGARRGELLSAEWSQFSLECEQPTWIKPPQNTKQRRRHRAGLSRLAVDVLLELRKETGSGRYLFPSGDSHRKDIKKFWRKVQTQAGLPDVRTHDLRHTFASILLVNGISLAMIGALLGHSSAQTTKRYAHLSDDAGAEAANKVAMFIKAM